MSCGVPHFGPGHYFKANLILQVSMQYGYVYILTGALSLCSVLEAVQDAKPQISQRSVTATDQQGVPQAADVILKSGPHQQPKLDAIKSQHTRPKTTFQPRTMSNFSFSKAAGLQQQQPEGKSSWLGSKSKALPDSKSTDGNGTHSKPAVPKATDADREEAAFWKDKGNMAFKAQKWEVAAEAYSRWASPTPSLAQENRPFTLLLQACSGKLPKS